MHVGFTGTQATMTQAQWEKLCWLLQQLEPTHCHHGDCVGSDAYFHQAAKQQARLVVSHPPDNDSKRAFCQADETRPPKPYLERNKDIVHESYCLIAVPKTAFEEQRSGTWSTVRHARKLHRLIYIILPNGAIHTENMVIQ